jgi:hypothetical protein
MYFKLQGDSLHLYCQSVYALMQKSYGVYCVGNCEVIFACCSQITLPEQDLALILHRNYMNDSLRTDVFVRYQPETVACACIYLTSRKLNISLPKSPAWFGVFRVSEEDIQDVCFRILRLYRRPKVSHRQDYLYLLVRPLYFFS